jgi:hypothetical protein
MRKRNGGFVPGEVEIFDEDLVERVAHGGR